MKKPTKTTAATPSKTSSRDNFDARVTAAIARAGAGTKPILEHLRAVVHEAVPEATETIKWGRPFFLLDGEILCNAVAFKAHASFGFWSASMTAHLDKDGVRPADGSGSFGKLTSVTDLPSRRVLVGYVKTAADLLRAGKGQSRTAGRPRTMSRPEIPVPDDFTRALGRSKKAKSAFEAFAPSCRREYLEWITGAKQEATRARRIDKAIGQIAEGKSLNWKYESS